MQRRTLAAIVLLALAVGLGGWYVVSQASGRTGDCPPGPELQATGVVLSVDGTSLVDVRSFVLRTAAGEQLTIGVGRLDIVNGFNAAHLREHQASAAPVVAHYRLECDRPVAYLLTDG
jgi:hypothetical protein